MGRAGIAVAVALVSMLVAGTPSPTHAQAGMNLSWTDCGTFGVLQKNFACNTNAGSNMLVASVIAPAPLEHVNGMQASIEIQTNQAALSPWWHLESGGCRDGALVPNFNFTTGYINCMDLWGGQAASKFSVFPGYGGAPNRTRILVVCSVPEEIAILDDSEYYAFSLALDRSKSVGSGACAGCTDGACIVLSYIKLTRLEIHGDVYVVSPITRHYVQWQSGGNIGGNCPPMHTPVRASTWGSVKSMYR